MFRFVLLMMIVVPVSVPQGIPATTSPVDPTVLQTANVSDKSKIRPEDPVANHRDALTALQELISKAESLRDQLETNGPAVISKKSLGLSSEIEKLAKKVKSNLRRT